MSIDAADGLALPAGSALARRNLDHWFYAGFAVLLLATALAGFVPSSLEKLAAVRAGARPPLPPLLHVHAAVMGSWVALFLTQSLLPAAGRTALHRRLGVAAFALAPLVVIVMALQTRSAWTGLVALPPGAMPPEALAGTKQFVANLLLEQLKVLLLFPLLVGWALSVRRTDREMHKRLMILATLMPLMAGIDRLSQRWLPTTFPVSGYEAEYGYLVLWLAPALIFDLWRRGRVHRAYVIGLTLNVPFFLATHYLWNSPRWYAAAPHLMGVTGW